LLNKIIHIHEIYEKKTFIEEKETKIKIEKMENIIQRRIEKIKILKNQAKLLEQTVNNEIEGI